MEAGDAFGQVFDIIIGKDPAAEVGLQHGQDRVVIAGLEEDLGLEAAFGEDLVDHGPHGGPLVHQHEGLIAQGADIQGGEPLAWRGRGGRGDGVDRRDGQEQLFGVDGLIDVAGPVCVC